MLSFLLCFVLKLGWYSGFLEVCHMLHLYRLNFGLYSQLILVSQGVIAIGMFLARALLISFIASSETWEKVAGLLSVDCVWVLFLERCSLCCVLMSSALAFFAGLVLHFNWGSIEFWQHVILEKICDFGVIAAVMCFWYNVIHANGVGHCGNNEMNCVKILKYKVQYVYLKWMASRLFVRFP